MAEIDGSVVEGAADDRGVDVFGRAVAQGEQELVFAPLSEILPVHGVDVLGLFPRQFQAPVVMTAGIAAGARDPDGAKALIKFMTSSKAAPAIKASGMEPATSS